MGVFQPEDVITKETTESSSAGVQDMTTNGAADHKQADAAAPKPTRQKAKPAKKRQGKGGSTLPQRPRAKTAAARRAKRAFPKCTLEDALRVPIALREKNGGNPWSPSEVALAMEIGPKSPEFYYVTAASRDYGLTTGTRDSQSVELSEFGRKLMYAGNPTEEAKLRLQAFLNVDLFKRVLEHYGGNNLPEMKYLTNTLESKFGIEPSIHEEFSTLFKANCDYLRIGPRFSGNAQSFAVDSVLVPDDLVVGSGRDVYTVAEAETSSGLVCFAAMPFRERTEQYLPGYFAEVLNSLIAPAGRKAGFTVQTARKEGTDVIQSTIVNRLLSADLVLIDLTEHNPNVLFELGLRIASEKPVVLIRAEGTAAIFDVDNMLRVFDYAANLWPSTLERDIPKLAEHIKASFESASTDRSYMSILSAS